MAAHSIVLAAVAGGNKIQGSSVSTIGRSSPRSGRGTWRASDCAWAVCVGAEAFLTEQAATRPHCPVCHLSYKHAGRTAPRVVSISSPGGLLPTLSWSRRLTLTAFNPHLRSEVVSRECSVQHAGVYRHSCVLAAGAADPVTQPFRQLHI